jgi:hypothetical protein
MNLKKKSVIFKKKKKKEGKDPKLKNFPLSKSLYPSPCKCVKLNGLTWFFYYY